MKRLDKHPAISVTRPSIPGGILPTTFSCRKAGSTNCRTSPDCTDQRARPKQRERALRAFALSICCALTGCVSPLSLDQAVQGYNEVTTEILAKQLLANSMIVVRS